MFYSDLCLGYILKRRASHARIGVQRRENESLSDPNIGNKRSRSSGQSVLFIVHREIIDVFCKNSRLVQLPVNTQHVERGDLVISALRHVVI